MKMIEALSHLFKLRQSVFETSDAAACLKIEKGHASKVLSRLAQAEHLVSLRKGIWALPEKTDLLSVPQYLTRPFPTYISLQTALYHHGFISQIPEVVYAVSLARTKRFQTPLGVISIHHIQPDFFFGFKWNPEATYKIATPEKALLDIFYLSPAKSRLFQSLPESELPAHFSLRLVRQMIKKIKSRGRRKLVERRFEKWLGYSNSYPVLTDRQGE